MRRNQERVFVTREQELGLRKNRIITPSNIDAWFGYWRGDDELTQQQVRELAEAGFDPATVETMDVFLRTTAKQLWVPSGAFGAPPNYPWRRIRCPIVGRRLDGRVKVIAPIGDRKLVWEDGSINRPKTRNRRAL